MRGLSGIASDERLSSRNVLHSYAWTIRIITPSTTATALLGSTPSDKFWAVLGFNFLLCAVYSGLYIYFSIKDPNRLQSEHFQLNQQGLDIIGEKGKDISVDTMSSIQGILNPESGRGFN